MHGRLSVWLWTGWFCSVWLATAARAETVLDEDFTDNRRAWPETHGTEGGTTGLKVTARDGAYVCENPTASYWLGWIPADLDPNRDFLIEASLRQTAGPAGAYGVLWGLRDTGNFREFSVWGHNRFSYAERVSNEFHALLQGEWDAPGGPALVTLSVRREGTVLEFLINGHTVGRAEFRDLAGNNVGFVVNGGMTVAIERLVITQPRPTDLQTIAPAAPTTAPAPPVESATTSAADPAAPTAVPALPAETVPAPTQSTAEAIPLWRSSLAIIAVFVPALALLFVWATRQRPPGR